MIIFLTSHYLSETLPSDNPSTASNRPRHKTDSMVEAVFVTDILETNFE